MASPYDALKILQALTKTRHGLREPSETETFRRAMRSMRQGGLTETQIKTMPYLEELKAKEERRKRLLQPVETLFDVLNRGQYVTANIAQQITDNMTQGREWWLGIPNAVKEGLTGARKGDWEKVLFGGELAGKQVAGWIPWRPETMAGKIAKGVAGFGANVLLDPTTYISFGAASASKGAATKYADDVVKLTLKEIGKNATDVLPKMIQSGYDAKKFGELLAKNAPEGFSYLARYAGDDITKLLSRTWKEAYRTGLRTPAAKLTEDVTARIKNLMQEVTGKEVSTVVKQAPGAFLKEAKQLTGKVAPVSEYDRLAKMLAGVEGGAYAGAGQRAARFMRHEFAVGERYPTWLQVMDQMRGRFQKSKLGGAFSDAWWAVMNSERSPIAKLKKMVRIRNPYQKMLSIMERDITYETAASTAVKMNKIRQVIEPLSKDQMDRVTEAMVVSQVLQEHAKRVGKTPVAAETIARRLVVDEKDADIVAAAIGKINETTKGWEDFNRWAVSQGVARDMGHWEDYLPIQPSGTKAWKKSGTQLGTARPGWMMQRDIGWGEHLKQDIGKMKWMFGLDTETAEKALVEGIGDINLDLQNMLMRRAFAQARFEQHVNMVLQFREFGLNVADLQPDNPEIYNALVGKWGNLEPLGMKPVHGAMGLEGYLFDREVADIFDRAINVSSNDKGLKALANVLSGFTSWWRGWATLSPGFHMRNFMSNNVTGFLKHGPAWLNPQAHMEAFVAATIALNGPEEGFKKLSKIMPADTVREILARRIGDKTLGELAEYGGMKGVASRMSMGFAQPKTYQEVSQAGGKLFQGANINPFSNRFAMFGASREAGAYIESTAKMQSFLLDYRKAIKQGANAGTAMDWAKNQARFFFLDYGDLSSVEQKWGRNIIPFYSWVRGNLGVQITGMMQMPEMYCVPQDAEILTKNGWKKYWELEEGEDVLTYNLSRKLQQWQPLKAINVFDFSGYLFSFKNRIGEFLSTENHRWVVQTNDTRTLKIVETKEINTNHSFLNVAMSEIPEHSILSPREAALLGWIVTDGCIWYNTNPKKGKKARLVICQSPNKYLQEIRELADDYCTGEHIHKKSGCVYLRLSYRLRDVFSSAGFNSKADLPSVITRLNEKSLYALHDAMFKAEGADNEKYKSWTQQNGPVLEAFQIASQLLGISFGLYPKKDKSSLNMFNGTLRKRKRINVSKMKIDKVWHEGKVWCPSTENGTWIMRQNGQPIITGNSMVGKATAAARAEGAPGQREFPEWMQELGMIPIAETDEGLYRMFWPNYPYQDINKLPIKFEMRGGVPVPVAQDPWQTVSDIAQDAHPLIKNIIEVIGGVDIFYREPLGEVRKAPRLTRVFTKSPGMLTFLDGLLRRVGFEDGLKADVNDKGQLVMDAKMAKVLEDNIILLDRIPQFLDLPELLVPAIEKVKQRVTGAVDDYEGTEEALQVLSFYLGIKMKESDIEEERFRRNQEMIEEAQAERRKAERYTPQHMQRSLKWQQQAKRTQRKLGL